MLRFCFVAIICCLLVVCCLCDENSGVNEKASNDQQQFLVGGLTEQNPKDPKYKRLAEESVIKYLLEVGNYRFHKVLQVTRVTTQLVSGTITRVNFIAAPTNCLLNSDLTPVNPPCKVTCKDFSNLLGCYSEIWEQAWLNRKEIKVSCDRVN